MPTFTTPQFSLIEINKAQKSHNKTGHLPISKLKLNFDKHIAMIKRKYSQSISKLLRMKRNQAGFRGKERFWAKGRKGQEHKSHEIHSVPHDDPYQTLQKDPEAVDLGITNIEVGQVTFKDTNVRRLSNPRTQKNRDGHSMGRLTKVSYALQLQIELFSHLGRFTSHKQERLHYDARL